MISEKTKDNFWLSEQQRGVPVEIVPELRVSARWSLAHSSIVGVARNSLRKGTQQHRQSQICRKVRIWYLSPVGISDSPRWSLTQKTPNQNPEKRCRISAVVGISADALADAPF
ncbi:hypothetical protein ACQR1W_33155 [Bradyrhizobium sp. HKCCYLS1011]|uniref:hypothetical protein n=1 Tax=Bradyrhizobium sp. HKCCYLS1011 TaxID=3420733 RepID=UPI003EB89FD7